MSRQITRLCYSCRERMDQANGGPYYMETVEDSMEFGTCMNCHKKTYTEAVEFESVQMAAARRNWKRHQEEISGRHRDHRARHTEPWRDWT